jgi:hypothetical protein
MVSIHDSKQKSGAGLLTSTVLSLIQMQCKWADDLLIKQNLGSKFVHIILITKIIFCENKL